MCLVSPGSTPEKSLTTIADVVCDVTKTRGVTEVRMTDHAMQPKMKAAFQKYQWSSVFKMLMLDTNMVLFVWGSA